MQSTSIVRARSTCTGGATTYISFGINLHLRPLVVEFHVTLPDSSATLHGLDPLLQPILLHYTFSTCLTDPDN